MFPQKQQSSYYIVFIGKKAELKETEISRYK